MALIWTCAQVGHCAVIKGGGFTEYHAFSAQIHERIFMMVA